MAIVLGVIAGYLIVGVLFALAFVARGAGAIDAAARRAPFRVRLLFAPGAAALWPILLTKWLRAGSAVAHRLAGGSH